MDKTDLKCTKTNQKMTKYVLYEKSRSEPTANTSLKRTKNDQKLDQKEAKLAKRVNQK